MAEVFTFPTLAALNEALVACRRCSRLVAHREAVAREKRRAFRDQVYWGRPVPGFGDPEGWLLILGLAPGAHGSNRTGRMFTGDASGDFLYPALHRAGFASQPQATAADDGLSLRGCYITAVLRCVPPGNRPTAAELAACRPWLAAELEHLPNLRVVLALGRIAHEGFLRLRGLRLRAYPFRHGAAHRLPDGLWLLDSYHVSRQNTQTGRLTREMFDRVLARARALGEGG